MKKTLGITVLVSLMLAAATAAIAQFEPDYDYRQPYWSIHAGAAWMLGDTPDDVSFIGGLAYETPVYDSDYGSYLGFSADYIPVKTEGVLVYDPQTNTSFVEGEGTVSLVPLLAYLKRVGFTGDNRIWGMVGLGASFAEDDIPEMAIDEGWNFAWMLGGGVDITPQLFAQLRYIAGSHPSDDGIVTTEIGWRF